jgi:hypothetical protein
MGELLHDILCQIQPSRKLDLPFDMLIVTSNLIRKYIDIIS